MQAYCNTFWSQGTALHSQWSSSANSGNPLGQFATVMSAPSDLEVFFDKLDKVAPDGIEPDVAAVRDSLKKQLDALGSSSPTMGGLLGAAWQQLIIGMSNGGSWQRVDDYTTRNCGSPPQG